MLVRISLIARLLAILSALSACSAQPSVSPDSYPLLLEALSGEAILGRPYQAHELPQQDILALTEQMRAFVESSTGGVKDRAARSRRLLRSVMAPGLLGIRYGEEHTLSASDVFRTQSANCLAFSNLFVALAREAGLKAQFQDVLVAPDWEMKDGSVTLRRHVNVVVDVSRGMSQVIDLGEARLNLLRLKSRRMTDDEAFAQFYNNLAIDYLHERDFQRSFFHIRKALTLDPNAAFIWSNLGVLLSRVNKLEHAESALLFAIELDAGEYASMVNLAAIYKAQERTEEAQLFAAKVERYRQQNPYFLLLTAREHYQAENFNAALKVLRRAINLKPEEALLHELLAKTHLRMDNKDAAKEALQKAAELSESIESRRRYNRKLDKLS